MSWIQWLLIAATMFAGSMLPTQPRIAVSPAPQRLATAGSNATARDGRLPMPPLVSIRPDGGVWNGTDSIEVSIYMCANASTVFTNFTVTNGVGTDITAGFTVASWSSPPTECIISEKRVGKIGPPGKPIGNGVVIASVEALSVPGTPGADTVTFVRSSGAARGVTIAAAGEFEEIPAGQNVNRRFAVTNIGSVASTYNFTIACTAIRTGTSCPTAAPLTVNAGAVDTVFVSIPVTSTVGATTSVRVTAVDAGDASTRDSARAEVVAIATRPQGVVAARVFDRLERSLCTNIAVRGAAVQCGDLVITHALPAVRTMGVARAPTLVYTSRVANPWPVFPVDVTVGNTTTPWDSVYATLSVDIGGGYLAPVRAAWNGGEYPNLRARRIALAWPGSVPTGVHQYSLTVRKKRIGGADSLVGVATGEFVAVNRSAAPMGLGWWLAGLEELQVTSLRLLWIGGDGSARIYRRASTAVTAFRPDSLIAGPDSITIDGTGYRRHFAGGGYVQFNAAGRHVATQPRVATANPTLYEYETVNGITRLRKILVRSRSAPSPISYTFAYSANDSTNRALTSVTLTSTHGSGLTRTTTFSRNSGRITAIRAPGDSAVFLGYSSNYPARINSRRDRRGHLTTYTYNERSQTVAQVRVPTDSLTDTTYITDVLTRGLRDSVGGSGTISSEGWYTEVNGPRRDVDDRTRFHVNAWGAPFRVRNPAGFETLVTFDSRWRALPARVRGSDGVEQTAEYDTTHALLQRTRSINVRFIGDTATTTYGGWLPKYRVPGWVKTPLVDTARFGYDTATGNRLWERPGSNTARQVTYAYNSHGQVVSIDPPGIAGKDSIVYDALGNDSLQISPMGRRRSGLSDAIGRPTLAVSPVDSGPFIRTDSVFTWYNLAGRVDSTRRTVPVDTTFDATVRSAIVVRHTYDLEGNVLSTVRQTYNDGAPTTVGMGWTYDTLGRVTSESAPEFGTKGYAYDAAGNVVTSSDGAGRAVYTSYDAMGRPIRRTSPAIVGGAVHCNFTGCQYTSLPRRGPVCIAADTAVFRYDRAGRMVRADNRYARIRRVYTPGGLLATDTVINRDYFTRAAGGDACNEGAPQTGNLFTFPEGWVQGGGGGGCCDEIRSSASVVAEVPVGSDAEFYSYRWVLRYVYDAAGRRDSLAYSLDGGSTWQRQGYRYEAATGQLDRVKDFLGYDHDFSYDDAGRLTQRTAPYWTESYAYDDDGNTTVRDGTTLSYDYRGLIVEANGPFGYATNVYNGFGAVIRTTGSSSVAPEEKFWVNGLGHRRLQRQALATPSEWDPGERTVTTGAAGRVTNVSYQTSTDFSVATSYGHDGAGNQNREEYEEHVNTYSTQRHVYTLAGSWYDALGKLRVYTRHAGLFATSDQNAVGRRSVHEDYRYDALGRRIVVRSRRDANCTSMSDECRSYLDRALWDGDQLLVEMRGPGGEGVVGDAQSEVVSYSHGLGIDAPLAVIKGNVGFVPHANWRGVWRNGSLLSNGTPMSGVRWPATEEAMDGTPQPTRNSEASSDWWGGLINGMSSGSGQKYMRNRYYDPATSQFTQSDPIGLGGGLNLYGYAGGDPINFSDPFGLCTKKDGGKDCDKMISAAEGRAILARAVESGEWTYSQQPSGRHRDPSTPLPGQELGDCTDLCRRSTQRALGPSWRSERKASTGMFRANDHPGFTEVEPKLAQTGDVVVRGGHAGIFIGRTPDGHVWGWANNGTPTQADGTGYRDGTTGARDFTTNRFGGDAIRFFRPIRR